MVKMLQDIRGAAPLRMAFRRFACAGVAMMFVSCIAVTAAAQQSTADESEIAPASDAPPLSAPPLRITQHYTPAAPQSRAALTLLVDAPPAPGAPAQQTASQETPLPVPVGDHLEGPAINALAQGRSAITVSILAARRR